MKPNKEEQVWLKEQLTARRSKISQQIDRALSDLHNFEASVFAYNACNHRWVTRIGTGDHDDVTQCANCHICAEHTPALYAPLIARELKFLASHGIKLNRLTKERWVSNQKRAKIKQLEKQLAELKSKP